MTPVAAPRMSERELQDNVIRLARVLGYRVCHFRPALTKKGWRTPVEADGKGFPDLVLVRPLRAPIGEFITPGRVLYRELKGEAGRLTADQQAWAEALRAAGADYAVWTPESWPTVIQADLEARQ